MARRGVAVQGVILHGKTVFLIPRRCRVYLAGRYGHMPSDKTIATATPSPPSGQMPCDKATRRRRRRLRHLLLRDLLAHSTAYPPSTRHSSTHPSTTRPVSHSPTYFTAASPSSASPSTRPQVPTAVVKGGGASSSPSSSHSASSLPSSATSPPSSSSSLPSSVEQENAILRARVGQLEAEAAKVRV